MYLSDIEDILVSHCIRLYKLCLFASDKNNRNTVLNRRFLGRFHLEATWMEETLDGAGARKSDKWFPFREGVSAIKLFSSVTYDVLHVKKSSPHYNLLEIEEDFGQEVDRVLDDLYLSLVEISGYLIKRTRKYGLKNNLTRYEPAEFNDYDGTERFSSDRKLRHIENPGKTLVYLATEFLSHKSEMKIFDRLLNHDNRDFREYIPDSISEEKLRLVLARFHNLQSLYDTYLSDSDIEYADNRLKVLRGHISMIFHMIKSATKFSHYYERHIIPREKSVFFKSLLPMDINRYLEITINFFMRYPVKYFEAAKDICHMVIDSYAEIEEKYINIPQYRGFHVRPSTLLSKIVNYYGGKVHMYLGDQEYDPSTPLELFRVNEKINATKRQKIIDMINREKLEECSLVILINRLVHSGDVVIYNSEWDEVGKNDEETNLEFLKRGFALLLASGKLDIRMDLKIKFVGDKRSLDDIEILAINGYGEDLYGNNIPLPKELCYLKR